MKMILWTNKRSQASEQSIHQDSKLLAPVVFFAELVYGQIGQCSAQASQKAIEYAKARPFICLHLIFEILQFEISSLMNWIFFLVWTGFLLPV